MTVNEVFMRSKYVAWIGLLIFVSISLRSVFYIFYKAFIENDLNGLDWVAAPIGLVSLYIAYMYYRRLFPAKLK